MSTQANPIDLGWVSNYVPFGGVITHSEGGSGVIPGSSPTTEDYYTVEYPSGVQSITITLQIGGAQGNEEVYGYIQPLWGAAHYSIGQASGYYVGALPPGTHDSLAADSVTYTVPSGNPGRAEFAIGGFDQLNGSFHNLLYNVIVAVNVESPPTAQKPDLVVSSITPAASSVAQGTNLSFSYVVKNQGNAAAGLNYSSWQVDSKPVVGSGNVWDKLSSLAAGATASFTDSISTSGLSVGTHTLWVDADNWNNVAESKETNNSTSVTFNVTAPPLPDLVVASITPNATSVTQGASFGFSYVVQNNGAATAGMSWAGIYLDQQTTTLPMGWNRIGALSPTVSATATNSFSTAGLSVGVHTLWVKADYWNDATNMANSGNNDVVESNENNNWTSATFNVTAPIGLHINLIADSSVASAPSGFVTAVQTAAHVLEQAFTDNVTLNVRYGWGTFNNTTYSPLIGATGAVGGPVSGDPAAYSTLKSWLTADATSTQDSTAIASLPTSNSLLPNQNSFFVASAQEKALGHFAGNNSTVDGAIGFGTSSSSSFWLGAALHEITHAMGRTTNYYEGGAPTIMDLYRFSSAGHYQWTGGQAAYFSINGGTTKIANFGVSSDYGDLLNDSLTPNDPFDEFLNNATALTAADVTVMDVIGFNRAAGSAEPASAPIATSSTITISDANAHVAVGNNAIPSVSPLPAANTSQNVVFNGGADSNTFVTVAPGATVEIGSAFDKQAAFVGDTGTLKLDDPSSFSGTVAGMSGHDTIDLANINFATVQSPTYSGDSSGGTLAVTDGTHTANIALLGNYLASTFVTSSDGHGGANVVDPSATETNQTPLLVQPHHA